MQRIQLPHVHSSPSFYQSVQRIHSNVTILRGSIKGKTVKRSPHFANQIARLNINFEYLSSAAYSKARFSKKNFTGDAKYPSV